MTGDQEGMDFTEVFMEQAKAFLKGHYSFLHHFDMKIRTSAWRVI